MTDIKVYQGNQIGGCVTVISATHDGKPIIQLSNMKAFVWNHTAGAFTKDYLDR